MVAEKGFRDNWQGQGVNYISERLALENMHPANVFIDELTGKPISKIDSKCLLIPLFGTILPRKGLCLINRADIIIFGLNEVDVPKNL